tara:strand:+ start:442 stop:618 length:177 start_codon:yes stop_codon:yes gene_type:complete
MPPSLLKPAPKLTPQSKLLGSNSSEVSYKIRPESKVSFGGVLRSGKPYTKPVKGNETI